VSDLATTLGTADAVVTAAGAVEGSAWVVGGAVRDALLDREVVDADIVVSPGTEADAAKGIARASGGAAFPLSEEFGTWRAIGADRDWHVDVTALRGPDLDADLGSRDFTVNAVAVPLAELDATPIDPTGGVADLERRVLRAVSDRSFADDPLRLLRAARLAATLGLEIDPGTAELARAESGRAAEPAGERRLAELRLLVAGPDPIRAFALLDELGGTQGVLPELEALHGVEQNPNHHLDVHGHTIEVLRQLLVIEADLDTYTGESAHGVRELLAQPLGDGFTRGEGLRLGALMHDVGKPRTKGEHSGYVTFIGHDSVGADLVAQSLGRLGASRALSRYVEGLTRHHLHLGFMVHERPVPARRLYEYLAQCGDVAPDVTLLTAADRMSARGSGPVAAPEMISAHLELVREVLPAALEWQRQGPPGLPIRGDDLARALGIEEGPRLGALLEELRAAVFAGEVEDREAAVEHARRSLAATSE
jgi:putative nucleotidyltransferase with HDIG domain